MFTNILMILAILGILGILGYRYYKSLDDSTDYDMEEDDYIDIPTLTNKVMQQFSMLQKQDIREKNMTRQQYEQNQLKKAEMRMNLKDAGYGNSNAKKNIKGQIKGFLLSSDLNMGVSEATIDNIISFRNPDELRNTDKFEIVLYCYNNYMTDEKGQPYKKRGFAHLVEDYGLMETVTVNDDQMLDFTEARLNQIYDDLMSKIDLTFQDKMEILAQRIFEKYKGAGVCDMLIFDSDLDEIDIGTGGVSQDGYDIEYAKNQVFSYRTIWITIKGEKMRLSCIGLDSQEELIRVVQNIYKYGANQVLNRKTGKVVSVMQNGSRVVVMRPPFGSSYAACIRKFDSTPSIAPEALIRGKNAIIPITMIKWLIKGERTAGITGQQGTGKSTMLKSLIRYIKPTYSIRVQEITAELNLQYTYPHRNIIAFQETDSISSQDGIDFSKKTNGDYLIIGELAQAVQASYIIQATQVATRATLFTHHAKTAYDFITAIANNLLDPVYGIYRDKREAIETTAKALNIDIHLVNNNTMRYMERITEIIPLKAEDYPTEKDGSAKYEEDAREYYKRVTDRKLFDAVNLVEYHDGEFVLTHMFSDDMMDDIRSRLSAQEITEFENDMAMLMDIAKEAEKDRKRMQDEKKRRDAAMLARAKVRAANA